MLLSSRGAAMEDEIQTQLGLLAEQKLKNPRRAKKLLDAIFHSLNQLSVDELFEHVYPEKSTAGKQTFSFFVFSNNKKFLFHSV